MADISQIKLPNGDTYNLVDETSGYIKNYIEVDPVFSASAAAGITSTDIANWNAKSDTDTKVTQSVTTTSNWRKVLVHYSTNTAQDDVPATTTNQVYAAKGVEIQPSNRLKYN